LNDIWRTTSRKKHPSFISLYLLAAMGAATQFISEKPAPHLQKCSRSHTCKNVGAPKKNEEDRDRRGRGQARKKIQKACRYWLAGNCMHTGDDCKYLHSHVVGGSDVTFLTKLVGHSNKVCSFSVSLFALHILSLFWLASGFLAPSAYSWFARSLLVSLQHVLCFLVSLSFFHIHLICLVSLSFLHIHLICLVSLSFLHTHLICLVSLFYVLCFWVFLSSLHIHLIYFLPTGYSRDCFSFSFRRC
jgi:hypothetical protein